MFLPNAQNSTAKSGTSSGGVYQPTFTSSWDQANKTGSETRLEDFLNSYIPSHLTLGAVNSAYIGRVYGFTGAEINYPTDPALDLTSGSAFSVRAFKTSSSKWLKKASGVQAYLREYYDENREFILNALDERLREISERPDNWDDKASKKPEENAIIRATVLLRNMYNAITTAGYVWKDPFITSDEEGHVTIEWHKGKHELHIDMDDSTQEFIKVWGVNIEHEMHVGVLDKSKYANLWDWLIHG